MADNVAGSYANLGGTEIVNDARTFAYLKNGLRPPSLQVYGDCGCPTILELVESTGEGCITGYVTPEDDSAPWFSADIPESADFAGFIVEEFTGLSSTFTRPTTEAIFDGGILGRGRIAGRTMTWRGYLVGSSCCGVAYGLRWLAQALASGSDCRDCSGDDLILLTCCPEVVDENTPSSFRLLKSVGLVEGPSILSERKTGCPNGCGMSCIVEIEFTLYAAQPFLYEDPIPLYDCENLTQGGDLLTVPDESCEPINCGDRTLNIICPQPVLPPTAVYQNPCVQDLGCVEKALYLTVPRSSWGFLQEVVPVISITSNLNPVQNIEIGFYISNNENPCGDLALNPPGCDAICDELTIIVIEAGSTFYIDGRTRKMSLICGPTTVFPGEPFVNGPWAWPSFKEFGFCLQIKYPDPECANALPVDGVCVSLSLVPRTI